MHARETVDVAALLAFGARNLLEDCPRLSEVALSEYWASSRCRFDEWGRSLRSLEATRGDQHAADWSRTLQAIAEEVLIARVLTRTVAALAVAHDRRRRVDEAGPVARNVLDAHGEAVRRVRSLIRSPSPGARGRRNRLNAFSAKVERWTDLLLGYIAPLCEPPGPTTPSGHAVEFGFDPARVQEFAYDASLHATAADRQSAGASPLLLASLQSAFANSTAAPACPSLNRRVAGAALGLFGPEAFDGHGLLRSATIARIERAADDAFGLIEQLFNERAKPKAADMPPTRWG